jgi:acyl carrier protein
MSGSAGASSVSADEIRQWLVKRVAEHLEVPPEEINVQRPFAEFGLDSRTAVTMAGELETFVNREVSPTLVWDYPTIEAVVEHLSSPTS